MHYIQFNSNVMIYRKTKIGLRIMKIHNRLSGSTYVFFIKYNSNGAQGITNWEERS